MTRTTGGTTVSTLANLPGLSASAKRVIALLSVPGQVPADVIHQWEWGVRDPCCSLYDPHYRGCGIWDCCPITYDLRDLFITTERHLPRKDARRLFLQYRGLRERAAAR